MNNKGQSLLEVIVAMAIFALISSAMVSLSLGGLSALEQGGEQTEAEALAQEGVEAVRAIRDGAWNKLVYATSSVEINGSEWEFTGEDATEVIGQYTRTISFSDVCRDSNDDIVACPGSYTDLHSKKAIVTVDWEIRPGVNNSVQKITYLTNWDSIDWVQTDWSSGAGQSIWSDATRYDSDDSNLDYGDSGEIKLASLGGGGCGAKVWSFVSSSDYTFDSEKIEVTGGVAQLFSSGGGGMDGFTQGMWHLDESSGDIIDYSSNSNDLDHDKGSPQYSQSGKFANSLDFNANSSRYINHGSQTGLNFTTFFTIEAWVYRDVVATTYESVVSKWRETGNKRSYALVINPNNKLELWVSSNGSNETILTAVNTLPTSSWVHITATYDGSNLYIFQNGVLENQVSYSSGIADKASFFSISGADKFNGGNAFFDGKIDEVRISNTARWTSGFTPPTSAYGPASYSIDVPSINPNISETVTEIDAWSSFSETATKNGGEIYYQLSDDDGFSWRYWDGLDWGVAGGSDYNTATDINTNISSFSTSTGQIMFKAFLESDGSQLVQLDEVEISCSQSYEWPFSTAENYNYDDEKIEVTSGVAQLIASGGGLVEGDTLNNEFGSNSDGWSFNTWSKGGGDVTPTGIWQSSGGNPSGYVDINIPSNAKNDKVGGYWQQSINITEDSADVTCSFDWSILDWTASNGVDDYQIYIFLDDSTGEPSTGDAIWSSGEQGSASAWSGQQDIDCSAVASSADTYYYKIAVWLDAKNKNTGPIRAGFDNASVHWEKSTASSYSTDSPSINPTATFSVSTSSLNAWNTFAEVATKNGGEIYYQLSDDIGSTWQYWDGGSWSLVGGGDYNTVVDVNTNISTFSTTTGQIMFKAFLESDGIQQVELDSVTVAWGEGGGGGGGGFATFGYLISSAYDMGDTSPVQILEWDEDVSSCDPTCDIKLQLRVAPDSGGSPGAWTSWSGSGGAGTYFTNPFGTLLSTDLNDRQWVQYRAELSGDGVSSPVLQEVRVNYK